VTWCSDQQPIVKVCPFSYAFKKVKIDFNIFLQKTLVIVKNLRFLKIASLLYLVLSFLLLFKKCKYLQSRILCKD